MARNKKDKAKEVASAVTDIDVGAFIERIYDACQERIARGAFGGLTFEQVLALTNRKKALRVPWPDFEKLMLRLTKEGKLMCQDKRYYVPTAARDVNWNISRGLGKITVPGSLRTKPVETKTDSQTELFGGADG